MKNSVELSVNNNSYIKITNNRVQDRFKKVYSRNKILKKTNKTCNMNINNLSDDKSVQKLQNNRKEKLNNYKKEN